MSRRVVALLLLLIAVVAAGAAAATERDDPADDIDAAPLGPSPVTPVLSPRRVPDLLAAPVADRRLVAALDGLLAAQPGVACLTVSASGRPVYAHNAEAPLVPASLLKLVTAVAAIEVLGPNHRFRTRVVATAAPVDGVVIGDMWLVGGGDPLLATAAYAARFRNQPQVITPIDALADALVRLGITRIDGRLLGDESRYDTDRYPDPWPPRFVAQDQSGPLSALSVNDAWVAFPPTPDATAPDETPAAEPAAQGAAVLQQLLADRGVTVAGGAGAGVAPPGAVEIAGIESPPLREVVGQMLRESDNQTAELLLKELAVAHGRPGTTADGVAVVADVVGGATAVDGSGLGSGNQLTCSLTMSLLDDEHRSLFDAGLPVAGQTGTLSRRFLDVAVTGRLRAKTGTLNQVTALAGYLTTLPGVELTFGYIVNLSPPDRVDEADLALQDQLAALLARYPEGPALETIGPQPVVAVDDG